VGGELDQSGARSILLGFVEITRQVSETLDSAGFAEQAAELRRLGETAADQKIPGQVREEALKQIEMRCHVRWLGDLFLPDLSLQAWWEMLGKLARATKKYRRRRSPF
jgi:hypothetical protein